MHKQCKPRKVSHDIDTPIAHARIGSQVVWIVLVVKCEKSIEQDGPGKAFKKYNLVMLSFFNLLELVAS